MFIIIIIISNPDGNDHMFYGYSIYGICEFTFVNFRDISS